MMANIHRRHVLGLLITSASAGRLTTAAVAAETRRVNDLHIYTDALVRAQAIIDLAAQHPRTILPTITQMVDDLLNHLLATFDGPTDRDSIQTLLHQSKADMASLTDHDLERLSRSVVPFAILRELVRKHGVVFDAQCSGYQRFVQRYASAILD